MRLAGNGWRQLPAGFVFLIALSVNAILTV